MSCEVPRLVPYHKMMPHVNSLDLGQIGDVREKFREGLYEENKDNGC